MNQLNNNYQNFNRKIILEKIIKNQLIQIKTFDSSVNNNKI